MMLDTPVQRGIAVVALLGTLAAAWTLTAPLRSEPVVQEEAQDSPGAQHEAQAEALDAPVAQEEAPEEAPDAPVWPEDRTWDGETHVLTPSGTAGGTCTPEDPCLRIEDALRIAEHGDIVELEGGLYQRELLDGPHHLDADGDGVLIRPADNAEVTIDGLEIRVPRLTIQDLMVSSATMISPGGDGTRLHRLMIDGATYIASVQDVDIIDSTMRPPPDEDGLQIKPLNVGDELPRNIRVVGNTIGPGMLSAGNEAHVDAVQILGGSGLIVAGNHLLEADSATMHVSASMGSVDDVLIADNLIEQCYPMRTGCGAYYALQVRGEPTAVTNVRVHRNSIAGAAFFDVLDGFEATGNAITVPIGCVTGMIGNVLHADSWACDHAVNTLVPDPALAENGTLATPDGVTSAGVSRPRPSHVLLPSYPSDGSSSSPRR